MASDKPLSITTISEEEVKSLTNVKGARSYKWEFPEETFDGQWWAIEVPNNKVASALNSYRNQAQAVYKTRASCYRGNDGRLFVRRLVDEPYALGDGRDRRKPS